MINLSKLLNFSDSSWNDTRDPCSWKGVACSSGNSSVTSLFLSRLGLSNSNFLPDVCKIETLQSLDLSNNRLSLIPDDFVNGCGRIDGLKLLNFSQNKLAGSLPTFNGFVGLESLDLSFNSLSGNVSQQLDGLLALKILNLSFNKFSGPLPVNLGKSLLLEKLQLSMNQFQGAIPQDIANCQNLNLLDLSGNVLDGSIPARIGNLTKLKFLNDLTGSVPTVLGNLNALQVLKLQHNRGPIPVTVNSMNSLLELQLGQNKLNGTIPLMPVRLQISLNLSSNLFQGAIPGGNAGLINSSATKTPQEPPKKGKSVAVTVVLAVVAAVLSAGVVSIIVVSLFRRFLKVNNQQSQSGEELPPPQVIEGNLLTTNGIHRSNIDFTKAMEIAANPLNIELKTRFSTYYKATMPSGASYFVKKLNWSDKIFQLGSHHKFGQELEVLGKLSNTNVMTPLAYVLSTDSAYLFYEYAEKGTLFDVLHGKLGDALDWASRYSIAVGVAQGLTFLHGCTSGPILLLDLSSQNILLKSLKEPVVGDIELHKVIDPTKSTSSLSTIAGSVGYIPPVSEGTELAKWVLSKSAQKDRRDHILDSNISRTSPAVRGQMLAVLKIALSCVSVSTEARPKMKSVLRMILTA
ncbi:hypothetical protein OIU84_017308 [Salix udensis]|uniref:Protein kinase domain-containing protein n=1 Tax=Salix udensis TaxID=889485 RepID=A0AAD6PMC0_9ROSI|nr:hypothetical protein OIU84_017308 [Salix udensis]